MEKLIFKGIESIVISENIVYYIYDVRKLDITLAGKKLRDKSIVYLYTADEGDVQINIIGSSKSIDTSSMTNGKCYKLIVNATSDIDFEELNEANEGGSGGGEYNPVVELTSEQILDWNNLVIDPAKKYVMNYKFTSTNEKYTGGLEGVVEFSNIDKNTKLGEGVLSFHFDDGIKSGDYVANVIIDFDTTHYPEFYPETVPNDFVGVIKEYHELTYNIRLAFDPEIRYTKTNYDWQGSEDYQVPLFVYISKESYSSPNWVFQNILFYSKNITILSDLKTLPDGLGQGEFNYLYQPATATEKFISDLYIGRNCTIIFGSESINGGMEDYSFIGTTFHNNVTAVLPYIGPKNSIIFQGNYNDFYAGSGMIIGSDENGNTWKVDLSALGKGTPVSIMKSYYADFCKYAYNLELSNEFYIDSYYKFDYYKGYFKSDYPNAIKFHEDNGSYEVLISPFSKGRIIYPQSSQIDQSFTINPIPFDCLVVYRSQELGERRFYKCKIDFNCEFSYSNSQNNPAWTSGKCVRAPWFDVVNPDNEKPYLGFVNKSQDYYYNILIPDPNYQYQPGDEITVYKCNWPGQSFAEMESYTDVFTFSDLNISSFNGKIVSAEWEDGRGGINKLPCIPEMIQTSHDDGTTWESWTSDMFINTQIDDFFEVPTPEKYYPNTKYNNVHIKNSYITIVDKNYMEYGLNNIFIEGVYRLTLDTSVSEVVDSETKYLISNVKINPGSYGDDYGDNQTVVVNNNYDTTVGLNSSGTIVAKNLFD